MLERLHFTSASLPLSLAERALVETEIERLLWLLDASDGDPDLEEDDGDMEHDGREPEE